MSDLDGLAGQMATDILEHAFRLEDGRLGLFLKWLTAHNSRIRSDTNMLRKSRDDFKSALQTWLSSLSAQGALWEYRLIMDEIAWWCDLDPQRLDMILKSEAGQ